jgi:hypothetical protein
MIDRQDQLSFLLIFGPIVLLVIAIVMLCSCQTVNDEEDHIVEENEKVEPIHLHASRFQAFSSRFSHEFPNNGHNRPCLDRMALP